MMASSKLKSSMSVVNMTVTSEIKKQVMDDVKTPVNESWPLYFHSMAKFTISLFNFTSFPDEFGSNLRKEMIEALMMLDLEDSGALNWVEGLQRLYPLKTKGDGNCLLHGASLGMWGIHDNNAFLRRLIHLALVNDGIDCDHHRFRKRWRYSREQENSRLASQIEGGLQYSSRDWDVEWSEVIHNASDVNYQGSTDQPRFDFLEDIHVFVLANVLRRPIFILSTSSAQSVAGSLGQSNVFLGIYLPLLWSQRCCVKSPLVLGYSCSHFCPLLPTSTSEDSSSHRVEELVAVPLVLKNMLSLPVKFLLPEEENRVADLMNRYLDLDELTVHDMPISVAKISLDIMPEVQELLDSYLYEMQKAHRTTELKPKIPLPQENTNKNNAEPGEGTFGADANAKDVPLTKTDDLLRVKISSPLSSQRASYAHGAVSKSHDHKVNCIEPCCNNKTDKQTHPHCIAHNHKHTKDENTIGPLIETGGSIREIRRFNSANNGGPTNSFSHSKSDPDPRPCLVCGCEFYGLKEWGYKCSKHRSTPPQLHPNKARELSREEIEEPRLVSVSEEAEEEARFSAEEAPNLNSTTEKSWQRCRNGVRTGGCNNSGLSQLGGRCHDCYMAAAKKESAQTARVSKCTTKLCRHPGRPDHHYYCDECWEKKAHLSHFPKKASAADMSSHEILALLPTTINESFEAREYFRCRYGNCSRVSTEQTLGYCNKHFVELYRARKIDIPSAQQVQEFLEKITFKEGQSAMMVPYKCKTQNCYGYQTKSGKGYCYFCEPSHEKRNFRLDLSEPSSPERQPSMTPPEAHETGTDDSASEMVTSLTRHSPTPAAEPPAALRAPSSNDLEPPAAVRAPSSNDLVESATPSSAENSPTRKCKFEHCQNTGQAAYNGLCASCYTTLLEQKGVKETRATASTDRAPEFVVPVRRPKHTEEKKSDQRQQDKSQKCRTPACDMYGTDNQQGYCSKCFKDYKTRSKHLDELSKSTIPEVMSTLPLDTTARPCIQCGDRYGDPVLQGFCTKCATERGVITQLAVNPSGASNVDICDRTV